MCGATVAYQVFGIFSEHCHQSGVIERANLLYLIKLLNAEFRVNFDRYPSIDEIYENDIYDKYDRYDDCCGYYERKAIKCYLCKRIADCDDDNGMCSSCLGEDEDEDEDEDEYNRYW